MSKLIVNQKSEFEIEFRDDRVILDGAELAIKINQIDSHRTMLVFNNRVFNTEVCSLNTDEKTATILVNGREYEVQLKNKFDVLLAQLGMENGASRKVQQVVAPMPGLVIELLVAKDTQVQKGDNLLVLEAMKMENIIKSPCDGRIKWVHIVAGDKVEKNMKLIEFE